MYYQYLNIGAAEGKYDIQSIAVHELGHAIGIAHCHKTGETCTSTTCASNVMQPTIGKNEIRRALAAYDSTSKRLIDQVTENYIQLPEGYALETGMDVILFLNEDGYCWGGQSIFPVADENVILNTTALE